MRVNCCALGVLLLLAWTNFVRADSSVAYYLVGANPAGTVNLTGTALPAPYNNPASYPNGVNCYAGILNWAANNSSVSPTNPITLETYCIDVSGIIGTGPDYPFTQIPFSETHTNPKTNFNMATMNAIENLFAEHLTAFGAPDDAADTSLAPHQAITQAQAGDFQVALWEIINNIGNNGSDTSVLGFNSASLLNLTTARAWAATAISHDSAGVAGLNLTALVSTDPTAGQGQNQVYIGLTPPRITQTPLPHSFAGGVALLAITGMGMWLRRRWGIIA